MGSTNNTTPGPVMQLLASGLQFWVRQQCQAIESLDLQLQGSAMALLRGQLAGVRLMARGVVYQNLQLELVELTSSPIAVNIGSVLKGQPLQLQQPFTIEGQISFSAEGLTQSLTHPQWRDLGDQLADALLGITPLVELRISQNHLIVAAQPAGAQNRVELETELRVQGGSVAICPLRDDLAVPLPLDHGITVERANLEGGMVQLFGKAQVSVGAGSQAAA